MSTHPAAPPAPPARIDAPKDLTLPFLLVYPIARSKIAAQTPKGSDPIIELRILIDERSVLVHLADPAGDQIRVDTPDADIAITRTAGSWMHIDAPGVVSCSISGINTDSPELVYAKTMLLGQLGLGGGRFEPPTLRSIGSH